MPKPTAETSTRPRADQMHDIEAKHFGRCIDQLWGSGRRSLIERMEWPKGGGTVMLVKHFAYGVPDGYGDWPDLIGVQAYVEIHDDGTWGGFDAKLTELENAHDDPDYDDNGNLKAGVDH